MIRVFLPPASYIEQLVSVPGKSSARRFSPEKTGFSNTFLEILRCSSRGASSCRTLEMSLVISLAGFLLPRNSALNLCRGGVFVLVKYYIFIPNLMQQIGFVEWQLASDTYTGKAGVYLSNVLATK